MDYQAEIKAFVPTCPQEAQDQAVILRFIDQHRDNALLRGNEIAHITSSGFILNPTLDRALLVHHNIRGVWAWTGGHADGEADLLAVAIREAREETGVTAIRPLSRRIASLDILPVFGHVRKGAYVNAHLHLSVAYLLICEEGEALRIQPEENTAVVWFPTERFNAEHFDASDVMLYNKLVQRAKAWLGHG